MTKKIRTGFYGGSFNPIHEAHLALGDYLISNALVDECWFVVSPLNPLKKTADPADARFRLEAVSHALEGHSGCTASDIEFHLPLPSYTVQTLRYAIEKYPEREFVLLIGGDNLDVFTKWKEYEYLLAHFDILVYPRPGASNKVPEDWKRMRIIDGPMMDISSTEIRKTKKSSTRT
ncbi:MAG: nicotinate (nicotinamide) nucleotide adenylyltransferase [Bacteroidales bacterium]|nr:nicotinate (nicotinamide) nucleotide adenylyltransferase [Bacteroidales bacterium]